MLSMKAIKDTVIGYYVNVAREDYYLAAGDPEGVWMCGGAEALGLSEKVERDALRNLFHGYSEEELHALH